MYIRIILFGILIYLIIRLIRRFLSTIRTPDDNTSKSKTSNSRRKVSKDAGEYVDYEEMDDR
ncbi:MAG: hypothetical protein K8R35_06315 [Bacteroidales bacterium]|nr:hypothetical protein [Bacteroidales bacterium]